MSGDMEPEYEAGESSFQFKSSYIMVAIDTHSTMFESNGQPTPFKNCLSALYRLSDYLLLKNGWIPFSVQLYESDEKATLIDFKDNMIETTKLLKQKCSLSEENLKLEYMRSKNLDLAEFFQLCKRKFKDISSTYYKRILIFITNDSDPVSGDASRRFTALQEAKNFGNNDINFQLIVTQEDFDYANFYNELFSLLDKPPMEIICEDEEGLFQKFISTISFRLSQRKLDFYPFANDFSKKMSVYKKSYISVERILNNNYVAVDGTPVKRMAQQARQEIKPDAKYILKNKKKRKLFYDVELNQQEKMERDMDGRGRFPIGFTLLYVCHRISGRGEVIAEPKIIEADAKSKLPFFYQFWQYCVSLDKVLVCVRVMHRGDRPKTVELIPKLVEGNKVFLEKKLAYAGESFEPVLREENTCVVTEEQKNITHDLVEQLTYEFQKDLLIDRAHLKKKEYVKSKLLDEERSEVSSKELLTPQEIDDKLNIDGFFSCFPPPRGVKRKK